MKKNFEAPYLKVVTVKNDIITGSDVNAGIGGGFTNKALAPGRGGVMDDETNDEMDF